MPETLGDLLREQHSAMHTDVATWNDEIRGWEVKRTEHWIVVVLPMLFNYRLILVRHGEERSGWTAGWCYDKGLPAFAAAAVFDPETQVRPVGFKKEAGDAREGGLL